MSKQEFIDRLRTALNGRLPAAKVEETVSYYQDYINTEIRKGKSEEEVLEALGDPRLIARTIIQTSGSESSGVGGEYEYDARGYGNAEARGRQGEYTEYQMGGILGWLQRMPRWLVVLLTVVIVLVVLSIVFSVLSALAPLIIVMVLVLFFVKLFRDWLN